MKMCSSCKEKEAWRKGRCKPCDYATSKAYEKTPKGYLVRTYRNMTNRVKGLTKSSHTYKGLPICNKEDFYEWSMREGSNYLSLLEGYKASGYERSLAPSVDRIDKDQGYLLDNMQWVTISKNVSLVAKTEEDIKNLPIGIQLTKNKKFRLEKTFRRIKYYKLFSTLEEACDYLNLILEEKI